jgi:uncharacterized protein YciI
MAQLVLTHPGWPAKRGNEKEPFIMWYIVLSRSVPENKASQTTHYDEHRRWLEDQHKAGRLLFSGPTTDGAYGIYILLASNLAEATSIAAQDSHHVRGIRTMEVLEWNPHRAFRMDKYTIADVERMATGK